MLTAKRGSINNTDGGFCLSGAAKAVKYRCSLFYCWCKVFFLGAEVQQIVNSDKYPPSSLALLLSSSDWESFIEDCCRILMVKDGKYKFVKRLGGAGDAGRDVEARYIDELLPGQWDLYQAKHYSKSIGESILYPELAKVFHFVSADVFPVPNIYYICAPLNTTPKLHDLIAHPDRHKVAFLKAWEEGSHGVSKFTFPLTDRTRGVVEEFDFSNIKELPIKDLVSIHSRDYEAHEALFGVVRPREKNPPTPVMPSSQEIRYIEELLNVYEEHGGASLDIEAALASSAYGEHLSGCRGEFYSAEGLKRFSRDVMPGEFEKLMESVYSGVKRVNSSPMHRIGLERLEAVLQAAANLPVTDNPLYRRLLPADLPGTCHQLVNDERMKWVK